jgi:hypothetical protein
VRLLVSYIPMLVIAVCMFSLSYVNGSTWLHPRDLAVEILLPVLLPIVAVLIITPVVLGAFLGRPLARMLVVLLLPPRLRVPLSFLWICDGKPPPKPMW